VAKKKKIKNDWIAQQLSEIGVDKKNNIVRRWYDDKGTKLKDSKEGEAQPVFEEDEHGNLVIHYFNLMGTPVRFRKGNNKGTTRYSITRLQHPEMQKGSLMKYLIPKGAGTFPFLPPSIIEKYQRKEKIKTLIATEGAKKAFRASLLGLDIVGLTSITHYREKKGVDMIQKEILDLIKVCRVENFVWLVDGDCRDLSDKFTNPEPDQKQKPEEVDLYRRPNLFFSSARNIKVLLSDAQVSIFFMNVKSDQLDSRPKGLDDLINKMDELEPKDGPIKIAADLTAMGKPPTYFHRIDLTGSLDALYDYFHLKSAQSFYNFYSQRIEERPFTFYGTKYRYNTTDGELEVIVPAASRNYVRVGDTYFEWVTIVDNHGHKTPELKRRLKSTITDDHGGNFTKHIPKMKDFVNIADHMNYQPIIHNCMNRYHELEHKPAELDPGDKVEDIIPETLKLIKHIFGTGKVKHRTREGKEVIIDEWELGLDYVQLLYQQPVQKLPILCLVSRENKTGKTTFADWLKAIFTKNMAIVGNADLANDFNSFWASKLLIACDETKIDKDVVIEKLKSLSTAKRIVVNQKGVDHVEFDFLGKFIMLTNNEDNFIRASDDDTRYWVRKVPVIPQEHRDVDIDKKLFDEIGYFLAYINTRKMKTVKEDRMWFAENLIRTDALRRVIHESRPAIQKQIASCLKEYFLSYDIEEIKMSTVDIDREFLNNKYKNDHHYVSKSAKEMGASRFTNEEGKEVSARYEYPKITSNIGANEQELIWMRAHGRPFVFKRVDFVTSEEMARVELSEEAKEASRPQLLPSEERPDIFSNSPIKEEF